MNNHMIIRKIDDLGRIVLPIEIRKLLDIEEREEMEISIEDDRVILKKHTPSCVFCGNTRRLIKHHDKWVCDTCIKRIQSL